jgi:uncharacterized protein (TIGR02001 family)
MKNMTKLLLGAASLAGLVAVAAPAFAQDAAAPADAAPASPWAVSAAIDVQSDYKFRGISQNKRDPSPQGTINITGPEGFYVGSWASTIDWQLAGINNNPGVEWDIYGGKHTDLWGVDWNFEPYYYSYPSEEYGAGPNADYFELINQLSKAFGPATLTATWAWSDNLAFNGGTGNYLAGTASYTILDWLSVSGNVGHQWAQNAKYVGSSDYTYADIGATATWKGFALDLRYSGTDLNNAKCSAFYMATNHACAGNFIATLTYNISLLP